MVYICCRITINSIFKKPWKLCVLLSFRIKLGREVQLTFFFFLIDLDELPQAQSLISNEPSHLHTHIPTLVKRES